MNFESLSFLCKGLGLASLSFEHLGFLRQFRGPMLLHGYATYFDVMGYNDHCFTCYDTLGRSSDAQQNVNRSTGLGNLDRPSYISIRDETDPCPRFSDLTDQICMAGSIKDYSSDISEGWGVITRHKNSEKMHTNNLFLKIHVHPHSFDLDQWKIMFLRQIHIRAEMCFDPRSIISSCESHPMFFFKALATASRF